MREFNFDFGEAVVHNTLRDHPDAVRRTLDAAKAYMRRKGIGGMG